MFRFTRYPMISKTKSGRVRYLKKYRVAGRVRVPAGHCQWLYNDYNNYIDNNDYNGYNDYNDYRDCNL